MSLFKVYPLYNVNPKYGEGCYVYDDKKTKYEFEVCRTTVRDYINHS